MLEVESLLPKLEPILAVAFALNLAYIGLERFRYRKAIREYVKSKMADLKDPADGIRDLKTYKIVARLSDLEDDGRRWYQRVEKDAKLPGVWGGMYALWFECHIDIFVITLLTFFCGILLCISVAHDTGVYSFLSSCFSSHNIGFSFWLTIAVGVFPVVSVICGRYTVRKARACAIEQVKEINKVEQLKVHEASLNAGE